MATSLSPPETEEVHEATRAKRSQCQTQPGEKGFLEQAMGNQRGEDQSQGATQEQQPARRQERFGGSSGLEQVLECFQPKLRQDLEHHLKDDVAEDAQNQFHQELKHG